MNSFPPGLCAGIRPRGSEFGPQGLTAGVRVPALPLTGFVTLGKLPHVTPCFATFISQMGAVTGCTRKTVVIVSIVKSWEVLRTVPGPVWAPPHPLPKPSPPPFLSSPGMRGAELCMKEYHLRFICSIFLSNNFLQINIFFFNLMASPVEIFFSSFSRH